MRRVLGTARLPHATSILEATPEPPSLARSWRAYKLHWRRRRLLLRGFRMRRQVRAVADRTAQIGTGDVLCFMTVRNESVRLPFFLAHHRKLGVAHFLIVDNTSDDGTHDYLAAQPDVSLWSTGHSYLQSRFGLDWLAWLQSRHGSGHWCLTLDADEILVYPHWETRPLRALTERLASEGRRSMGAMMLDMYPQGPLAAQTYAAGQDPAEVLPWFDAGNYVTQVQPLMRNLWIQGGVRARAFFGQRPRRAPTLNKVPLVLWNRRYAYVNSTHGLLPAHLNAVYDETGGEGLSGILLHTKFLPVVVEKSREERGRRQHFANSALYDDYYDGVIASPDLWCKHSQRYTGWRQLEGLGLMSRGGWV